MIRTIAGVETGSRVKGASTASSQEFKLSGTYSVHDNVLMLVKDGKNEPHMIFPVAGDNLNIDRQVYKKQAK
jgi:hypothetical protein